MKAVGGLVKDGFGVGFERRLIYLHAAIGRQTVHDQGVGLGQFDQRLVDLVPGQFPPAFGRLGFFAH